MKTKMKMMAALKVWVVIYPSITLLLFLFGEFLSAMPLLLRTFLLTVTLVPWMIFVGVPFVETIINWLSGKKNIPGNR